MFLTALIFGIADPAADQALFAAFAQPCQYVDYFTTMEAAALDGGWDRIAETTDTRVAALIAFDREEAGQTRSIAFKRAHDGRTAFLVISQAQKAPAEDSTSAQAEAQRREAEATKVRQWKSMQGQPEAVVQEVVTLTLRQQDIATRIARQKGANATEAVPSTNSCRVYDFDAPTALDPGVPIAWSGKLPSAVEDLGAGFVRQLWDPWLDELSLELDYVPAGHPESRDGLSGVVLIATAGRASR